MGGEKPDYPLKRFYTRLGMPERHWAAMIRTCAGKVTVCDFARCRLCEQTQISSFPF